MNAGGEKREPVHRCRDKVETGDRLAESCFDRQDLESRAAQFDLWNMAKVIERLPNQIEIALMDDMPPIPQGPFDQVVLAGMGGSALPMDVVTDVFRTGIKVPIKVSRQYQFPPSSGRASLIIVSSFSGNTEEVVEPIEKLPRNAPNVVVLTSGGRLAAIGNERGYPVIRIPVEHEPEGFQPRSAVGYMVTYLARLLFCADVLADPRAHLEALPAFLRKTDTRTPAEETAVWLRERIPVIYTDEAHLLSIARVMKIKFNENAKRPAFFNALPEANHNEMIGFAGPLAAFGLVYLHDPESHPRIRQRFNVMKQVFQHEKFDNVAFREWSMPGDGNVQRIFAALAFIEWCSYTLALLDGVDPTPVELVERFKQELATG